MQSFYTTSIQSVPSKLSNKHIHHLLRTTQKARKYWQWKSCPCVNLKVLQKCFWLCVNGYQTIAEFWLTRLISGILYISLRQASDKSTSVIEPCDFYEDCKKSPWKYLWKYKTIQLPANYYNLSNPLTYHVWEASFWQPEILDEVIWKVCC